MCLYGSSWCVCINVLSIVEKCPHFVFMHCLFPYDKRLNAYHMGIVAEYSQNQDVSFLGGESFIHAIVSGWRVDR